MTVDEVIHIAVIPLAIRYDVSKIKRSRLREQCEEFFRYILFSSEVVLMQIPSKKREGQFQVVSCRITFLWVKLYFCDLCPNAEASEPNTKYSPVNSKLTCGVQCQSNSPLVRLTASSFFLLMILAYTCVIFTSTWPSSFDTV